MSSGPLWRPSVERVEEANITAFAREVSARHGTPLDSYADLHHWSVSHSDSFWSEIWDYAGVVGTRGGTLVKDIQRMPGAKWFPGARLNFAENLLRRRDDGVAMVFRGEDRVKQSVTFEALQRRVSVLAQALRDTGVEPGDRVAAYIPNMPEAVIGMLATASIGGVWSSCSPDFGVQGVLDRFGQIEPKVLLSADGYFYNGKRHDSVKRLIEISAQLPSVRHLVVIPYAQENPDLSSLPGAVTLDDYVADFTAGEIEFARMPFNHPLYVMYSSGTTGVPKCIVHGVGGTLLQHMKEHLLHTDIKQGDRLFYFTTCGWMMWNWLVSGLGSGATLMLYDGSPFYPDGNVLFDYIAEEKIDVFGTSAKFIDAVRKADLAPVQTHDLTSLRTILSTGSPLVPESFDFVYEKIKQDVCLSSISGGTDLLSCFVLGNPTLPVWRGELQVKGLGLDVVVLGEGGELLPAGKKGELACRNSFPSMPIYFWNDADGATYHAAYFERAPGYWCQGDYVAETEHDGMIIYGRSDAVLNPGGVRIGTAEIYRQAEKIEAVVESLVIGQSWGDDVRVVLFVRLRDDMVLDDKLIAKIKTVIRDNTTVRHVPAKIIQVADIPRTKSGKIVELAVRSVVHGEPVKNREALANPEALDLFKNLPELQS